MEIYENPGFPNPGFRNLWFLISLLFCFARKSFLSFWALPAKKTLFFFFGGGGSSLFTPKKSKQGNEDRGKAPEKATHPKMQKVKLTVLKICVLGCVAFLGCSLFPSKRAPRHTRKRNTPENADIQNHQFSAFSGVLRVRVLFDACQNLHTIALTGYFERGALALSCGKRDFGRYIRDN